jgi:hypothetical protein
MGLNQQQLEKQGIYEAKCPLSSLLSDLDQVARIAEGLKARRRTRAHTAVFTILGGLLGAVLGAALSLGPLVGISIMAILAGIVWWIYSFFSFGKVLDHRARLDIARERLAMIQQDAGAQSPFELRLALASNPKRVSEEALPGRKNGRQRIFEDAWLSLEGRLLDGTVITDEIKDLKRERTYSNPRGKRKTKFRVTYLVSVRFSYSNDIYGDARPAGQAMQSQVKVAPSAMLRCVRVSEKAILLRALVMSDRDIARTVGMLSLGGYRILNLARRMAAGQQGNAK